MARARGGQFVLITGRGAWTPAFPELDRFLFATVGEEVDGMPLSVLSALARLDLDPRDEAARLSHVAGDAAADQLARTIARVPGGRWTSAEARKIAGGLIELLPRATRSANIEDGPGSATRKSSPRASSWLVALAVAGAILLGFVAQSSLSSGGHQLSQATYENRSPGSAR
jgi:hypothetical protein